VWDLRPEPREAIGEDRGGQGQAEYVPPGEYTVKMKSGDFHATTKLTVETEPGVHEGEFAAP